ncbi:MAG: glycogen synthase GlgA [Elusimicrobia bacterium]|nr:glycogen synthase GlgA [Elusimicrobiota bacterium]
MKILIAASEAVPFCKTGGLADVVGALGQKLGAAGHDVCLVLPKYRRVEASALEGGIARPIELPLGGQKVTASLRFLHRRAVSVYLVDYPTFYDREGLYGFDGKDYPDNDRRFILFCRAALEGCRAVGFKPDVIHCHDWQTALIPAYLKRSYGSDPFFADTASVLTIHNLAYQGNFGREALDQAGFSAEDFASDRFEYYGKFSFLKAGILCADRLSTVSATYAREIQESEERGFGFEGLLRKRGSDLEGILNGIDTELWNPETDSYLPARFSARDHARGKAVCKRAVQKEAGLRLEPQTPLVGIVSRLDYQKGLDLAIAAIAPRLGRCQLAVLGEGDAALQQEFASMARRHPGMAHFRSGFDEAFAHLLYAGCDLFLMPSRFEPCGLGQMIAMRYGGVPVVTRTGGLADTVSESSSEGRPANGFVAKPGDTQDLGAALDRALAGYAGRVKAAMESRFSWDQSVNAYLELYRKAIESRAGSATRGRR